MTLLDLSIRRAKESMSRLTTSPPPEGCMEVLSRETLDFLGELRAGSGLVGGLTPRLRGADATRTRPAPPEAAANR